MIGASAAGIASGAGTKVAGAAAARSSSRKRMSLVAGSPSASSAATRCPAPQGEVRMRLCALGLVSLGLVSSAHAQSFNCRYARTPDEVAICESARLSALDERLSSRFFRLRDSLYGPDRAPRSQSGGLAQCAPTVRKRPGLYWDRLSGQTRGAFRLVGLPVSGSIRPTQGCLRVLRPPSFSPS